MVHIFHITVELSARRLARRREDGRAIMTESGTLMMERIVETGSVRLWTESFGDPDHPAILLIMAAYWQGIAWPDEFCARLAVAPTTPAAMTARAARVAMGFCRRARVGSFVMAGWVGARRIATHTNLTICYEFWRQAPGRATFIRRRRCPAPPNWRK